MDNPTETEETKIINEELEDQITEDEPVRDVPTSDLDMNMLLANPAWQDLKPNLRSKLMKWIREEESQIKDKDGNVIEIKKTNFYDDLSAILAVYTRDFRLGNISTGNGEYEFVVHHLRLAVEYLTLDYKNCFMLSLNKSLSYLETSSSKKGFLRKLLQTIRYQQVDDENTDPEKKSPLGNIKKVK